MLPQAQVVPWWGTGRPAEFSPSGSHPVTGIAYRQEDRRVPLQNGGDSATASGQLHAFPGNEKFEFFGAPSWGSECSGNYQPRGNGKTARGIGSVDPSTLPPVPGTESLLEIWSADRTAPEQISILPVIGNRKPTSDRTHWLQPVPCSSRRGTCPGRKRRGRQSAPTAGSRTEKV